MSVIAYDDKIIALDSQLTCGEHLHHADKFMLVSDNVLLAWTGEMSQGLELCFWYVGGQIVDQYPAFQKTDNWTRLVVVKEGIISYYEATPFAIRSKAKYMAFGSGNAVALGAMYMGASPIQAVSASIEHCISCSGHIHAFDRKTLKRVQ